MDNSSKIEKLLGIMQHLRDPESGCPWDIKQTFHSIAPYTVEEAYEVADAIERNDLEDLCDELGDLLFQVVFHAQLAEEQGLFCFNDVVSAISQKLLRRHPHVFGDATINSAEEQTLAWEQHKEQERKNSGKHKSVLDGVAKSLPATSRAAKLQKRAAKVGFDWLEPAPIFTKVSEELAEVKQALNANSAMEHIEIEVGDLLFTVVNLARHLHVDPELALRRSNAKFETRFKKIESILELQGLSAQDVTQEKLDSLWQQIKSEENN